MTSHFFDFCLGQLGFTNWKEVRVIHCLARRQPRLMIITQKFVQKVKRFVARKFGKISKNEKFVKSKKIVPDQVLVLSMAKSLPSFSAVSAQNVIESRV